jgi:hypothetical protein
MFASAHLTSLTKMLSRRRVTTAGMPFPANVHDVTTGTALSASADT